MNKYEIGVWDTGIDSKMTVEAETLEEAQTLSLQALEIYLSKIGYIVLNNKTITVKLDQQNAISVATVKELK